MFFSMLIRSKFCDNWKEFTWKNILVNNLSQTSKHSQSEPSFAIHESERNTYLQHIDHAVEFKVCLHELFGHGSGKLLNENNIDTNKPPKHPLTGKPITTWYASNQRTSDVFGDMFMALEECRAEVIAAYLALNEDIMATMGYTTNSRVTSDDRKLYRQFYRLCT
jgi:dipeptidyl-peptidase-3